jgi:hypothetical protein
MGELTLPDFLFLLRLFEGNENGDADLECSVDDNLFAMRPFLVRYPSRLIW